MIGAVLVDSLEQGLLYGIMALGVFISFRVLNFPDLTVDGSLATGAGVTAGLIVYRGCDPLLATILGALAGVVAGVLTGILNTKFKILNLLAGILTMTLLYSVNLRVMGRPNIPLMGSRNLLDGLSGFMGRYSLLVAFSVLVILVKLFMDLFLKTEIGLALRATGDNEQMIVSCGVNTDLMRILGLALSNGLVALSGGLIAQYSGFADIGMGIGTVVAGLASIIVGETLLPKRSIGWATTSVVVGSVIYRIAIMTALRYGYSLGFQPSDLKLLTALIVIVALATPQVREMLNGKVKNKESLT